MTVDEMQHAMMRTPEGEAFEKPVGVADEIAIGEEEQFDQVEHRRGVGLRAGRR